jgi:hypothetical protein
MQKIENSCSNGNAMEGQDQEWSWIIQFDGATTKTIQKVFVGLTDQQLKRVFEQANRAFSREHNSPRSKCRPPSSQRFLPSIMWTDDLGASIVGKL